MSFQESNELVKIEDKCIRDAAPACIAKCPAHVDAAGIAKAVANGDFSGAYKLFSAVIPFTRIISESCSRICEGSCKRLELGGAVQIGALEKACVDFGYKKNALNKAFLPKKSERVAIIGGGISGLTAAYYLKRKGFAIDIFEKSDKLGGQLKSLIPQELIDADISILSELGVNYIYNTEIEAAALIDIAGRYNAVYVATGCESPVINRDKINDNTFHVEDGIFAGGSLRTNEYSSIHSLTDGRRASISIERHLQNVSKTAGRDKVGSYNTALYVSVRGVEYALPVKAAQERFTKDEAAQEAARCIDCSCKECINGCAFLEHYKTDPKKFIREVRNCLSISVGNRYANESINSCFECGFCEAVCPTGLDTGRVCGDAKKQMAETGKMPPSAHDFALKDMAHSGSPDCLIAKNQPGFDKSRYLFFPGCQLGATAPEIVKRVYADLRARLEGGVGLITGCCGAIAKWAAREELLSSALGEIKRLWLEMGSPLVITACPTCMVVFSENIPEMEVSGIWDWLKPDAVNPMPMKLAVHDACTVRGREDIHLAVRKLLTDMGMELSEPEYTGNLTQCCGYGGLAGFTNRALSDKAAYLLASQSADDFVVYCINCRDRLMANGKQAYHFLELVYGISERGIKKFGWSERRINRECLRNELLRDIWGEYMEEKPDIKIHIDDNVREMIENRMILLSDIQSAIKNGECGTKLKDAATGAFIASNRIGSVTFWVWYTKAEGGYKIHKAYSHRMVIEGM